MIDYYTLYEFYSFKKTQKLNVYFIAERNHIEHIVLSIFY